MDENSNESTDNGNQSTKGKDSDTMAEDEDIYGEEEDLLQFDFEASINAKKKSLNPTASSSNVAGLSAPNNNNNSQAQLSNLVAKQQNAVAPSSR